MNSKAAKIETIRGSQSVIHRIVIDSQPIYEVEWKERPGLSAKDRFASATILSSFKDDNYAAVIASLADGLYYMKFSEIDAKWTKNLETPLNNLIKLDSPPSSIELTSINQIKFKYTAKEDIYEVQADGTLLLDGKKVDTGVLIISKP